ATGKIDPLKDIATFCQSHSLWFHVDAAHAGAFVFSERARPLLRGWERADSIVIDFHKMLLSPSLLTAVLFRLGRDSYQAFAQKADYLWRADQTQEWWDLAKRTMECTRPMLGLRAYALLKHGGERLFEAYIDQALTATEAFASLIENTSDFELLTSPESNILCYQHTPEGLDRKATNELNQQIRAALIEDGKFFIVQVEKHGRTYLRSAVMNPFVKVAIFEELLDEIRRFGRMIQET
ncbi:MAG: pyridoxal phosphate-dependent decarboxylase family protein, partial [Verrucomicrobiales bacterium]